MFATTTVKHSGGDLCPVQVVNLVFIITLKPVVQYILSEYNSNAKVCLFVNIIESVYVSVELNASWIVCTEMALPGLKPVI